MKTFAAILLSVTLLTMIWLSLGWVSLLVVPSIALFALMTFAPLLIDWAKREELGRAGSAATVKNHSARF